MGTRRTDFSGSIVDLHRNFPRSVTLDDTCIKRYFVTHALADPPHHVAPHADPAPRRRLAEASAHGGGAPSRIGLDPPRDAGDHRALPQGPGSRVPVDHERVPGGPRAA